MKHKALLISIATASVGVALLGEGWGYGQDEGASVGFQEADRGGLASLHQEGHRTTSLPQGPRAVDSHAEVHEEHREVLANNDPGDGGDGRAEFTALALARIWVSENGFRRVSDDQTAILAVLRDRARRMGVDLITAMRRYCPRSFDRNRRGRRRWIAHLRADASVPEGWPQNLDWSRHSDVWRAMVSRASDLIASEQAGDKCVRVPQHWAARSFERPRLLGWEEVDCGNTSNAFWIRRVNPELYRRYAEMEGDPD